MKIVISILGILVVMAIMYLLSASKKDVPLKTVLKALGIQFIIAFILVKFPLGRLAIEKVSDVVTQVLTYGMDGISFVFGSLANSSAPTGSIFGIQTLGNIIFISALVGALYYLGILGFIVKVIGTVVGKLLGTSKVESFVAVANMFLGQTESPISVSYTHLDVYKRQVSNSIIKPSIIGKSNGKTIETLGTSILVVDPVSIEKLYELINTN